MKVHPSFYAGMLAIAGFFAACNDTETKKPGEEKTTDAKPVKIKDESVSYTAGNLPMQGYIAYDENSDARRPIVLVIPEWWGLNEYAKRRARELAELGYIAMAVDMFGGGKTADNPDSAGKYVTPFYADPQLAKTRFDAALAKVKTYAQADTTKVGGIGYCFGGAMILNMARLGEDLDGVVSFHGNLVGVPPSKETLKAKILVCHGEADPFVKPAEIAEFKKQMDSVGAMYIFKSYPGAVHAFTNPDATAMGEKFKIPIKYDAAADTASWKEMKTFFNDVFN